MSQAPRKMPNLSSIPPEIDSDYAWLKSHLALGGMIASRRKLAQKIAANLSERIGSGMLPYTLGVFGGWGSGKTTLLALLAEQLESVDCKIVYFNSWKYAGFMEIVPALIYKILQYGIRPGKDLEASARRILLALGKKYSDQVGDWAQTKIGINPVELFKDAFDAANAVRQAAAPVDREVLSEYYTQVDKAQDELRNALGKVASGQRPTHAVIALIDELDRCDPDEAFNVIKQMRVLFGMRDLPIAFVVSANPDPIGLAIKHRYGLETEKSDYETRKILEKFVDSYEDLSETTALESVVATLWKDEILPWILQIDMASRSLSYGDNTVLNATAFDAVNTSVPLFANLRVLRKSFEYVQANTVSNQHLLWTKWFLEICKQIHPSFRDELRMLATPLREVVRSSYASLFNVEHTVEQSGGKFILRYNTDKGRTLFSIFRSYFWEHARQKRTELDNSNDPDLVVRAKKLGKILADPIMVNFVVLLALLPLEELPSFSQLCKDRSRGDLADCTDALDHGLISQFGYELAS